MRIKVKKNETLYRHSLALPLLSDDPQELAWVSGFPSREKEKGYGRERFREKEMN
ncbi:MAG: hypothetical protein ACUVQZ_05705 [Candidatus Caldatribacteriaceae bacterium]